jgi:hypothetical protein
MIPLSENMDFMPIAFGLPQKLKRFKKTRKINPIERRKTAHGHFIRAMSIRKLSVLEPQVKKNLNRFKQNPHPSSNRSTDS